MHNIRRAPQRALPKYLCLQCRYTSTKHVSKVASKKARNHSAIMSTRADLAERAAILRDRVHSARIARREDWLLGPLAPNRAAADPEYGCVSTREIRGPKGLSRTKNGRSPYMLPEMTMKESLIRVGDRVVVVAEKGAASRERGKVGKVSEVRPKSQECVVEDLNLAYIKNPEALKAIDPEATTYRTVTLPLPLSAVRLVTTMTHPDGETCDTIISQLVKPPGRRGRFIANSDRIAGNWIRIPEPGESARKASKALKSYKSEKEKGKDKEKTPAAKEYAEADTLRIDAEQQTWSPTLLRAPMPGTVIDELRNKYSKYRTRHEPRYQLALENRERRKAEWKAWVASGGSMLTSPIKEAAAMARDQKAASTPKPELKWEILEKIGGVMASRGMELTKERKREMWRNLRKEEVVKASGEEMANKLKAGLIRESRDLDGDSKVTLADLEEWSDDDEWEEQQVLRELGLDKFIGEQIPPDQPEAKRDTEI